MSKKRRVLQGSASNIVRVLLSMLVSLVLPPFLVHRLSKAEYSAWVLILTLSAYVNLLDFGLQTAIGKFVAEHDAAGDRQASHDLVSTSFSILSIAALLAMVGVMVMAGYVPELFGQMPAALVPEVRLGVMAVGLSTAFALPFNAFTAIFTGLQRYAFPTVVAVSSRVGSAAVLILLLLLHGGLVQMAIVMAAFNVAAAVAQFLGWRSYARERVNFSFLVLHRTSALRLAKYGSVLSLWTVALLLISGLDTVIVGHYDYSNTGFYAIASSVTNVMLVLVASLFGPLMPALSSMQAGSTPTRLGELCIQTTRYCTLFLCLMGLPLLFGAYPLLSLWLRRHDYAARSALYLQVLVIGNVIRQLACPYVIAVVATGKQHLATISAVAEASVNIGLSIWLVQRIGAVGVAVGTLVGAFISVAVHISVSMRFTQGVIQFQRSRYLLEGWLRPLLVIVPSLLLYPFWRRLSMLPAAPAILALWLLLTVGFAWTLGLLPEDRQQARTILARLLYWRAEPHMRPPG
jgi:O-antigen/teichoic acid export membrane protein